MHPDEVVRVTLRGLTHDADTALAALLGIRDDDDAAAAAIFLQILSCRFDDALDSADAMRATGRLAAAAVAMARAVGTGLAWQFPDDVPAADRFSGLTSMLELETAMSSGQIAAASEIATRIGADEVPASIEQIWAGIALVRARGFAGRFTDADDLLTRIETAPALVGLPQLVLLVRGTRIFVDGHLGRVDAVDAGLAWLADSYPQTVKPDYVHAGAYVLAAFGVNALGHLEDAAKLMLHGGGGDNLPRLQVVDRVYGYEMLVEAALAENDAALALTWSEKAASLPIHGHNMAGAALGRIKARVANALSDHESGIRESADAGMLAALVGGDLEVVRARIIEASARAASGDRARGIDELEEAARRAETTGAAAVKAWAERELAAHGRRLRNVPGIGWDSLTPTQKVIARFAAAGLRNREIATALYVSEKTVESHVAAVLGALGTTNRVGIGRELGGDEVDPVFAAQVTPRQRDVALLVARGMSNGAISRELAISEKTVEKHLGDLFARLQVRSRSALAARVRGVSASIGSEHAP
ncbi:hypothetical protein GCM10022234_02050 [Aeromicrobium panaciterrae]|uniref:helix-turn-helix transcriptional regulator n=1 Tax=Aeromicrobium panaciterrae TaxID=363861 RepID=UPI0031E0C38F